jgi:DNA polymerase III epsilon subunit-like protein
MVTTYSGLQHLNGNLLCALDCETSGTRPGFHEVIQLACVPLNSDIRPLEGVRPFYTTIRPSHPERWDRNSAYVHNIDRDDLLTHAPSSDRVQDMLIEWFEKLDLPIGKSLVPVVANWQFEAGFLGAWLGGDLFHKIFHSHARDVMLYAIALNDRAAFAGEKCPFNKVGLASLCNKLGVTNGNPHDALADCLAEAEVYRALLHLDLF